MYAASGDQLIAPWFEGKDEMASARFLQFDHHRLINLFCEFAIRDNHVISVREMVVVQHR